MLICKRFKDIVYVYLALCEDGSSFLHALEYHTEVLNLGPFFQNSACYDFVRKSKQIPNRKLYYHFQCRFMW